MADIVGDPKLITFDHFRFCWMTGLMKRHYESSPWKAVVAAGYKIEPWEMGHIPIDYFVDPLKRIQATKWLVDQFEGLKTPAEITSTDFTNYGIQRLLDYNKRSAHKALVEAGFYTRPERRAFSPNGQFTEQQKRIDAVLGVIEELEKLGVDPHTITLQHFKDRNLGSLIKSFFGSNPQRAVQSALEARDARRSCKN